MASAQGSGVRKPAMPAAARRPRNLLGVGDEKRADGFCRWAAMPDTASCGRNWAELPMTAMATSVSSACGRRIVRWRGTCPCRPGWCRAYARWRCRRGRVGPRPSPRRRVVVTTRTLRLGAVAGGGRSPKAGIRAGLDVSTRIIPWTGRTRRKPHPDPAMAPVWVAARAAPASERPSL